MSTKNNAFLQSAIIALGLVGVAMADASPVAEGLLNDKPLSYIGVAQVDDSGRCVMFVNLGDPEAPDFRPVANAMGDVKLFAGLAATATTIARANLLPGVTVTYQRKVKAGVLGDPIAALKRVYKSFKAEKMQADKAIADVNIKLAAGVALGWNTQTGTLEAAEYADYQRRQATVTEWSTFVGGRVTELAASLTAAGIDPMTVV